MQFARQNRESPAGIYHVIDEQDWSRPDRSRIHVECVLQIFNLLETVLAGFLGLRITNLPNRFDERKAEAGSQPPGKIGNERPMPA